jgi:hypothetical protein
MEIRTCHMNRRESPKAREDDAAMTARPRPFVAAALNVLAVLSALQFGACRAQPSGARTTSASALPAGTIAAVGHRFLRLSQYSDVTAERKGGVLEFIHAWAIDASFAEAAMGGSMELGRLHQIERSVLARSLLEEMRDHALSEGPPTDQEVTKVQAERWFNVDRPAAAQTTHFVVLTKRGRQAEQAEALARKIAAAVHNITNSKAFILAAKRFPADGLDVVAESLPPVTADGRSIQLDLNGNPIGEGPQFDVTFSRAANAIDRVGAQSGIVRTRFGFHVILLDRKFPPRHVSIDTLREKYASEIYSRREQQMMQRAMEESKHRRPVRIEASFQEVIEQSRVFQ